VYFLDRAGCCTRRHEAIVGERFGLAAIAPAKYDTRDAHCPALLKRPENVRGFSGRRDSKKHIVPRHFTSQLPGKDLIEPIVVADRGQDRAIDSERLGRQRSPISSQSTDKFGRQVLCIRRRSAVSRDVDATAAPVSLNYCFNGVPKERHAFPSSPPTGAWLRWSAQDFSSVVQPAPRSP